jgi:hypothetical protein
MAWQTTVKPPSTIKNLKQFTDWWNSPEGAAAIRAEWGGKFDPMEAAIGGRRASYSAWQDAWAPLKWEGSPWAEKSAGYETGMNELAARIKAGVTPEDEQAAQDYAAKTFGMDPEAWKLLVANWAKRFTDPNATAVADAEAAAKYAETVAGSDFGKAQAKADRVMLAQMQDQMGKQLESIFGERGGMGGFSAAYELTLQLEHEFLRTRSQDAGNYFNQGVAAVNANNGYYRDLINQGAMTAQDYLTMRFDLLQESFQNYVTMMDQTKKDFETQYTLSENERQRIDANFASQIDQMEKQLLMEMGGYKNVEEYINALYSEWSQGLKDAQAIAMGEKETAGNFVLFALGAALMLIPGGQVAGLGLITTGLVGLF